MKRSRGRARRPQNSANRSYDSNGPDVRVRGTASQIYEKYQALARDAMSGGDRIMAENYQQHGEHYYRIMVSQMPQQTPDSDNNDAPREDVSEEMGEDTDAAPRSATRAPRAASTSSAANPARAANPTSSAPRSPRPPRTASGGTSGGAADEDASSSPSSESSEKQPEKSRRRGPLRRAPSPASE